jgi:7-cyano-7-deazaguanine reductase
MKYGEKEIREFDINSEENYWPNEHKKNYTINIELPEFMCMCPRSGYPDFATLKLYINSFMTRHISHENSANEIYDALYSKLKPKSMKLIADFNPRGNVHTIIEIDSSKN